MRIGPAMGAAALVAAAAVLPVQAARADAVQPFVTPQRDVDVTYAIMPGEGATPAEQRMRWSVARSRQRVDPPGGAAFMVTDYRSHLMMVVQLHDRGYTVIAAPGGPVAGPGERAASGYERLGGVQQVAGLSCTDWGTRDTGGRATEICLTEDGVMLRARQAGRVLLQAERVSYAPLPPELFLPPAGFRLIGPPAAGQRGAQKG